MNVSPLNIKSHENTRFLPYIPLIVGLLAGGLIWWCIKILPAMTIYYEEGVVNYKGWLFLKGHYTAYKDIRTEYLPLAWFPAGLAQWIFGPSVMVGRIFSSIFLILGTGFSVFAAKRIGGVRAMTFAMILASGHIFSIGYFCTGAPFAITMTFCAATIFFLSNPKRRLRDVAFAGIFVALAATTTPVMAVFSILLLIFVLIDRGGKAFGYAFAAFLITAIMILAPFFSNLDNLWLVYFPGKIFANINTLANPYLSFSFTYDIIFFKNFFLVFLPFLALIAIGIFFSEKKGTRSQNPKHEKRIIQFSIISFFTLAICLAWGQGLATREFYYINSISLLPLLLIPASIFGARLLSDKTLLLFGALIFFMLIYSSIFSNIIVCLLLFLIIAIILVNFILMKESRSVLSNILISILQIGILLLITAVWLIHVVPGLVLTSALIALLIKDLIKDNVSKKPLLLIILLISTLLMTSLASNMVWYKVDGEDKTDLERIWDVASVLQENTDENDRVLVYGSPYFLLEAGRAGYGPLINREKTMIFDEDDFWSERYNLYRPDDLYYWMNHADAMVLDYLGHKQNVDVRANSVVNNLRQKASSLYKLVKVFNPGDLYKNKGRPVYIYIRNKNSGIQTDDLETNSVVGGE